MKTILNSILAFLLMGGIAFATLTVTRIPVVKTGGSTPVLQNGSITDLGSSSGAGNVGIGSTAPGAALDVNGTVRAVQFLATGNGNSIYSGTVIANGNVGIGTTITSAATQLVVQGQPINDNPTLGSEFLTNSGWTSTGWTGDWSPDGWTNNSSNTSALSFPTAASNSTKYQIQTIVTGTYGSGSVTVAFGGQQESLSGLGTVNWGPTTTTTGNLVITPPSTFTGTIQITIFPITTASTALAEFLSSTGTDVFEFRENTASNTIALGNSAGGFITTGTDNQAIGFQALQNDTTGNLNTAIGTQSLQKNTTGTQNISIGYQTMQANITGGSDTAMGVQALTANTTGSGNTAYGNDSMSHNTTGGNNTALGYLTLAQNVSSSNNTAFGEGTLQNSTASNETAIGTGAMTSITSGGTNTAFGYNAGRYITGGSTANQTSSDSIYVGDVTEAKADGDTNEVVIGHNAIGNGNNTVTIGNSSTTSTDLLGNVGIGTANSAYTLDVQGTLTANALHMQDTAGVQWHCKPAVSTGVFTCTAG